MLIVSDGKDSYIIENISCTCPAGIERAWSHISAIAYAVVMEWNKRFAGDSVTDFPVFWGKGPTYSSVNHQAEFKEIIFSRPNKKPRINTDTCNIIKRWKKKEEFLNMKFRFKKLESHHKLLSFPNHHALQNFFNAKAKLWRRFWFRNPANQHICRTPSKTKGVHYGNQDLDY